MAVCLTNKLIPDQKQRVFMPIIGSRMHACFLYNIPTPSRRAPKRITPMQLAYERTIDNDDQ